MNMPRWIALGAIGLFPAGLDMSVGAQIPPMDQVDAIYIPVDLGRSARISPSLAADTIRTRTLVNLWHQDGDLAAMRRVLADPVKRAHAVGHFAEEDFVVSNPPWRKTAAANAPENDVWRRFRGRLEGGQIKTHASGNPAEYMRDMFADAKAEQFFVPDDHLGPLGLKIQQQIARAQINGNERVAAIWQKQLARLKPLGRTYGEYDTALITAARRLVGLSALKGAGRMAALSLAVDGSITCYRCANGELTPVQVEQAAGEAAAKAGAVAAATYVVVLAGANPVGLTVIVVGGVVYVLADYAIDRLRSSYASSPMTIAQIDEVMPIGWHREEP